MSASNRYLLGVFAVEFDTAFRRKNLKFGTIIADCPWNYAKTSGDPRMRGNIEKHYEPLTTARLCELPVRELARDDSVLLLWTTWPFLRDALNVMDAWGFTYVTGLSWVKIQHDHTMLHYGTGYWVRGCTEPILVGKRKRSFRTNYAGFIGEDLGHSRKPESLFELAEGALPGPYLELFARRARPGWTSIGNEAPATFGEDIAASIDRLLATNSTTAA